MLVSASGFSAGREKTQPTPKCESSKQISGKRIKSFPIKKHRRGVRNSVKVYKKNFSWVGNNIAGARSKWPSVKRWIRMKSPAILTLQETKFQLAGKHKLDGYIIYEHLRSEKNCRGWTFYGSCTGIESSPCEGWRKGY